MTRVAVAPTKFVDGIEAPGTRRRPRGAPKSAAPVPHTFDWRAAEGDAANTRGIRAPFQVMSLAAALATTWRTDAHLVTYVVRGPDGAPLEHQPRVNKGALDWITGEGFTVSCEALLVDVDNAGHGEWTNETQEQACERFAMLPGAVGFYFTRQGARVVQPLARAVPVDEIEPILLAWILELEAAGLRPDRACIDWTRLFRLPHVVRDGRPYRSPLVALDRMAPIAPPAPAPAPPKRAPRPPRKGEEPRPTQVTFAPKAAPLYEPLCRALGAAVTPLVGSRHGTLLAIAGALLGRRVPPGDVPSIIGQIASLAGLGDRVEIEMRGATDTVDRWMSRIAIRGFASLPKPIQSVIDDHTGRAAPRAAPAPTSPLAETTAALEQAIVRAPDGLSLIQAQCGLGKTRAARAVAAQRATKGDPNARRAPLGSKTAIAVPTTKLAQQVARDLAAAGVRVRRIFGVLSVLAADGSPVCSFAEAGRALASGGQSIPREFCDGRGSEPCELRDSCSAYGGTEGPEDARVIVGTHGQLGQLDELAGSTGLLVIDEPPPLLVPHLVTIDDVRFAEERLPQAFDDRYAAALAPALRALGDYLEYGPDEALATVVPFAHVLDYGVDPDLERRAFDATGGVGALEAARAAFPEGHRGGTAPPLQRRMAFASRRSPSLAAGLGRASRIAGLVWRGLRDGSRTVLRLEERDGVRVLVVTETDETLAAALGREGSCVAMDAGIDLHRPIYARAVGYEPPLHRASAADGAPITRTLYRARSQTRTGWLNRGRLEVTAGLAQALDVTVTWVLEHPETQRIGIITFPAAELAIRAALGEDVTAAWLKLRQTRRALDEAREVLGPIVARLPQRPELGHYGAMRGLDAWSLLDGVATLGDPWPNLGAVQHEADFLNLGCPRAEDETDWERRAEEQAAAELEQGHGRIRAVHRKRPARLLHVGGVMPRGWHDVEVRRPADGRPPNRATAAAGEVAALVAAAGGASEAAQAVGVTRRSLDRYAKGERSAPPALVVALRRVAEERSGHGPKALLRGSLNRPFGPSDEVQMSADAAIGATWLKGVSVHPCPVHSQPEPGDAAECTCGRGPGGGAEASGRLEDASAAGTAADGEASRLDGAVALRGAA